MDDSKALNIVDGFNRLFNKCLEKELELKEYLKNRYSDIPSELFSYKEVIYRLKNNIDKRPVCIICSEPVLFLHRDGRYYYSETCCMKCKLLNAGRKAEETKLKIYGLDKKSIYNKMKLTNLERYGVVNVFSSDLIKDRIKKTCVERYGVENYASSNEAMLKRTETNLLKYGVKNVFAADEIKEKIKQTNLERYEFENYMLSEEGRLLMSTIAKSEETINKRLNTNLEKYGSKGVLGNKEIYKKKLNSCKKHNTYRSSLEENFLYELLLSIDDNVERQYMSDEYPYACDFYMKKYRLYIEYNGSLYHHDRVFTGSDEDIKELWLLDELTKYVWSDLDVRKLKCAEDNNLNYLVIYPGWHKDWKYYCRLKKKGKDIKLIEYSIKELLKNNIKLYNRINII